MRRGTTPTLTFNISADGTLIKTLYITFKQLGDIVFEKTKNDCKVESDKIICELSQKETLKFKDKKDIQMQIRAVMDDDTAIASNIMITRIGEILKEGEI